MDLAKIRKKSLLSAGEDTPALAVAATAIVPHFESSMLQSFVEPRSFDEPRTPLEVILSGRTAAGCDAEATDADDTVPEVRAETNREFLCFRVSDEIYGIDIMDIKEIIKPREVTEVPRAPVFVTGILSLRGVIIPIIDMRIRLGLARSRQVGKERIIVVKNKNSMSGLFVDEVIQVVQVDSDTVEEAPAVMDGIARDFISGIGRSDDRLIIMVNVENCADIDRF